IGMFADWFEFRIGQNFFTRRERLPASDFAAGTSPALTTQSDSGPADLYLGVKLGLTEQKKYLPESALILQMTVPTGSRAFTSEEVSPGINYDFSWDIVKDRFSIEGVLSANRVRDDVGHGFVGLASGLTALYSLTRNLEAFGEWYGLYPAGAVAATTGPQHYAVTGLVYYFNNNFLIDVRAGMGLNEHASDFLAGTGFAVRY